MAKTDELINVLMKEPIPVEDAFTSIEGKNTVYMHEAGSSHPVGHYNYKHELPDGRVLRVYFCKMNDGIVGKENMPNNRLEIHVTQSNESLGFETSDYINGGGLDTFRIYLTPDKYYSWSYGPGGVRTNFINIEGPLKREYWPVSNDEIVNFYEELVNQAIAIITRQKRKATGRSEHVVNLLSFKDRYELTL